MRCASWMVALFTLLSGAVGFAKSTPEIDRPVVDRAGVVSLVVEERVGEMLRNHYEQTGVQMAVLLVDTTRPEPIEDYSLRVAQTWRGGREGEDRGVLLTLAIDDRRSRLEVGYGLESILTDALAADILARLRPALRAENYGRAVSLAVHEVVDRTDSLESGQPPGLFAVSPLWRVSVGFWLVLLFGFTSSIVLSVLVDREVGPFAGGRRFGLAFGVIVALAAGLAIAAFGVSLIGYLSVFVIGVLCGVFVAIYEGLLRFSPVVAMVSMAVAWWRWPELFGGDVQDLSEHLFMLAFATLAGSMLPLSVLNTANGSSYSSSSSGGFSSGGYSGGGGSFGGGGASGSW